MKVDKEKLLFYISLIWLVFPLYYSIYGESSISLLPATILMGVCYISCLYVKNKWLSYFNWLYMLCYIVVYFILYSNPGSLFMFTYITSLLTYNYADINLKSFRNITFYIALFLTLIHLAITTNLTVIEKFASLVIIAFFTFMYAGQRVSIVDYMKKQKDLEHNRYINNLLAENERNRIGRDLHDTLGHVFASLTLKTELALKLLEKEKYDSLKQELLDINNLTKSSMNSVREVVNNLKFRTINEEISLAKETLNLANISLEINTNLGLEKINPTLQSTVAMVLRELVNNVIKHSRADKVFLKISEDSSSLILEIEDNGIGFAYGKKVELKSIEERIVLLKGIVEIVSYKNPTTIKIKIPYGGN